MYLVDLVGRWYFLFDWEVVIGIGRLEDKYNDVFLTEGLWVW